MPVVLSLELMPHLLLLVLSLGEPSPRQEQYRPRQQSHHHQKATDIHAKMETKLFTSLQEDSGSHEKLIAISPRTLPTLEGLLPPRKAVTAAEYT
jgi:hypothetical protein